MDSLLLDSFTRLVAATCDLSAIRGSEETGDATNIQRAIQEAGFLDAMVPECKAGGGLDLPDLFPLFLACGELLLPVPFAETVVARALICAVGANVPTEQPILLWPATPDGRLRSQALPLGVQSALALVQTGEKFVLVPMRMGARDADPFRMTYASPVPGGEPLLTFENAEVDLLDWAAAITAAKMAGAMGRVLEMSLHYVNERHQFGRSLGKFQAVQQQLSVLAEKVAFAHVAARIGLSGSGLNLSRCRVATAKSATNEAAEVVVAIAHGVHGAIGISEQYSLHYYTRRLKRWQLSFGSASYWAQQVGLARLSVVGRTTADFVRERISGES
jgi:acyl-CoA dehydrogenase